jgi:aminoacyl-tRNA hydrolase
MANKILIVGLGNPGSEYEGTPHNAGFAVIDKLIAAISNSPQYRNETRHTAQQFPSLREVSRRDIISKQEKNFADIYETKIKNKKIMLVKPLLFMNNSGAAVKKLFTNYGLRLTSCEFILVHDDIDILLGSVRLSYNAGSAGHRGVEDVMLKLKTKTFWRFRIGTMLTAKRPRKRPKALVNKLVTQKLSGTNKKNLEKSINLTAKLIHDSIIHGKIEAGRKNYTI